MALKSNLIRAEKLISLDPDRWLKPVTEGLAQGSAEDYASLAFLTTLARPKDERFVGFEACDALGRLAARSPRAGSWVQEMFLSGRPAERFRGGAALRAAMELDPAYVTGVVALRMNRAAEMDYFQPKDREHRDRWLRGALEPLKYIRSSKAAKAALTIIEQYEYLVSSIGPDKRNTLYFGDWAPDYRLMEDFAEVRGGIAIFDDTIFEQLNNELNSDEILRRYNAARALRVTLFERSNRVKEQLSDSVEQAQDALLQALKSETDHKVLNALLWGSYSLAESQPQALLDAFEESAASRRSHPLSAGPGLTLLAKIATVRPELNAERVGEILPRVINTLEPAAQSFLSEVYSYAWWCCAENLTGDKRKSAIHHLEKLSEPTWSAAPSEFRAFQQRGAIVAQLALMSSGLILPKDLEVTQFGREGSLSYFAIGTENVIKNHARALSQLPDSDKLKLLLLKSISDEVASSENTAEDVSVLWSKEINDALFQTRRLSLQMLVQLLVTTEDPTPTLRSLPHGWEVFYAIRNLLEIGRTEDPFLDFAREICEQTSEVRLLSADDELRRCQVLLAQLSDDPHVAFERHISEGGGPFDLARRTEKLVVASDGKPEILLSQIDESIRSDDDFPVLHDWVAETRDWRSLLMGRVFERMFSTETIVRDEAYNLCVQMLTAVRALPGSARRSDYEFVYERIMSHIDSSITPHVSRALTSYKSLSPIESSHKCAMDILDKFQKPDEHEPAPYFSEFFQQRSGWWESYNYHLTESSLNWGSGFYVIYCFPAVRLAAVAVGSASLPDPAAHFMKERQAGFEFIKKYDWLLMTQEAAFEDNKRKALSEFEEKATQFSIDERVLSAYGHLLLTLGEVDQAEAILLKCLNLTLCDKETRASVIYNLACVYARTDREDDALQALQRSDELRHVDRKHLSTDPDFAKVRERSWFQNFLKVGQT